jgi:hypothetical protein
VVHHFPVNSISALASILSRSADLAVRTARDREPVAPGTSTSAGPIATSWSCAGSCGSPGDPVRTAAGPHRTLCSAVPHAAMEHG